MHNENAIINLLLAHNAAYAQRLQFVICCLLFSASSQYTNKCNYKKKPQILPPTYTHTRTTL